MKRMRPRSASAEGVRSSGPAVTSRPLRLHAAAWILIGLGLVLLGGACGDDSGSQNDGTPRATSGRLELAKAFPNVVTTRELSATRPGSPERAVLEWFQAIQFEDITGVRDWTDRSALSRTEGPALARAIATVGPALGKPEVRSVSPAGGAATVRVRIEGYLPGRSAASTIEPVRFQLLRQDGVWRLSSLRYLITAARRLAAPDPDRGP